MEAENTPPVVNESDSATMANGSTPPSPQTSAPTLTASSSTASAINGAAGASTATTGGVFAQASGPGGVHPVSFLPYLKTARFADAVLKIKTSDNKIKTLPVHRIVLSSRSSFFDDLFSVQPQPSETNSKGLPIYQVPILPAHKSLHEVLGLSLWWLYSMDDTKVSLPENKWDQIVGVHRVSDVFKLPRLTAESEKSLRNAIEGLQAPPDDLQRIAEESRKWGFPDIERRAISRLQDLIIGSDSIDSNLANTSLDTFSTVMDNTDSAKHFHLVRRYVDVKAQSRNPLALDASSSLWHRVPFDRLPLNDLESAHADLNVPRSLVLDAASHKITSDSTALNKTSFDLLSATLDHAVITSASPAPATATYTPIPPSTMYAMVRSYVVNNANLDDGMKSRLWSKVKFVELSVEELEEAYGDASVPRGAVVNAMFSRLRVTGIPSGSGSQTISSSASINSFPPTLGAPAVSAVDPTANGYPTTISEDAPLAVNAEAQRSSSYEGSSATNGYANGSAGSIGPSGRPARPDVEGEKKKKFGLF